MYTIYRFIKKLSIDLCYNTHMKKYFDRGKINKILDALKNAYPEAGCALNYDTKFHLLIAVVLSAQTTDVSVNKVTLDLWKKFPDARALSKANQEEVENLIKRIGLYKNKSKNIIGIARALQDRLNEMDEVKRNSYLDSEDNKDGVPDTYDELIKLPGVGRKTANVVLAEAFGEERIAVDTHVFRVSNRIGLTEADDVLKTEMQLMDILPEDRWTEAHHLIIWHGRNCCKARKPECESCPVAGLCLYNLHGK